MKIAVLGYGIIGKAIKQLLDNSHLSSRMSPLGKRIEVTAYDIIEQPNCTKLNHIREVTKNNDPTAHAEIVTIRKACNKLNSFNLIGTEMYTSCEPCPMCLSAIYWSHIDKIYYGNTRIDAA